MKVGVILPMGSHANEPEPIADVIAYARAAEAAGLDSLWAFDHAIFRFPGSAERGAHEPWTVMSLIGRAHV